MVTDRQVAEALKRFREAGEQTKPCPTCTGKGYHHGFGEHGHDPDWCVECGGAQFVAAFTEEQAMRAAIEAAEQVRQADLREAKKAKVANNYLGPIDLTPKDTPHG